MKVAIDISPLNSAHKVRGTGSYLNSLRESLLLERPEKDFVFFTSEEKIPKDIDVIHYPYFEPFFLTLPLKKRAKTVVTVHDLTPIVFRKEFPVGIKGALKWKLQKKSLRRSNAIITDSNSSKKDIEGILGCDSDKIHVVYLAASSIFKPLGDSVKKQIIKKYNLPEKFVLYVGDVTWNKNLPRLIEAINQTGEYLVIAGKAFNNKDYDHSNPWNKDLVKAQKLADKNKRIISLGFVSNEDLVGLYNAATIFVMPSLYEGFGLPVLEAMQCGCPVITSSKGSLGEVGGEAVYYIDPYETDSIKNAIVELDLDGNKRKVLSERGLAQAKKFSWEKTARETMEVYEKLYKQNNR